MERWIFFLSSMVTLAICEEINLSGYPCYKLPTTHINYRSARIVGGFDAKRENTPYMSVLTRSGGNVFCGSSIIAERFLIVAAHCVCSNQNKVIRPTQMRVYVGINKISDVKNREADNDVNNEDSPHEVFVERITLHPEYVCGKKSDSDIALLKLKRPIKFSDSIRPLCIEDDGGGDDGDKDISSHGIVSGFGMTNENLEIAIKPDILQSAVVPLWTNEECQASYASFSKSFVISKRQICAGGRNGHSDSCYSDSGGPLVDIKSGNLIGIVSNGIGCGRKGLPGIYVRVSKFTQWIKEQTLL